MKKIISMLLIITVCISITGCSLIIPTQNAASQSPAASVTAAELTPTAAPEPTPTPEPATTEPSPTMEPTPVPTAEPTVEPTVEPTAEPTVEPTPTKRPTPAPTVTPAPFKADKVDKAGEKGIQFDIYKSKVLADLTGDKRLDRIVFEAGNTNSHLSINGYSYTIKKGGLTQLIAITNIDKKDKYLEIVLTEKYDSGLADSEKAFSYLYWWDGKSLFEMGSLMDVKFDGKWRNSFHAAAHFNGAGQVTCLARTEEFTDIWYMARFKPQSSKRELTEAAYVAKPVNQHGKLKVLTSCLLLKNITTKYFKADGIGMYDPASWPHSDGRLPTDPDAADYTVIAQPGESLSIVGVYGKYWFKLKTADGKQGWIKVIDGKMQGYWQVMSWTVYDIFEGIMVAG